MSQLTLFFFISGFIVLGFIWHSWFMYSCGREDERALIKGRNEEYE